MFGRVSDFGAVNRDVFPESSKGGRTFAQVSAAVAAIEAHLTKRDLARVEARRVKASTRAAVFDYMKAIAHTARTATKDDPVRNPFVLPAQRTAAALLSVARLFIDESKPHEATFVELGLPPDFISAFTTLVEQLDAAVDVRNNGRARRAWAQTGIEEALAQGTEAIRILDVLIANALRGDVVRLGHWRGARRIEGLGSLTSAPAKVKAATPALTSPVLSSADPPAIEPVSTPVVPLEKVS